MLEDPIVISGSGVVAPGANNIKELRSRVLRADSPIQFHDIPVVGRVPAGICDYDVSQYMNKKSIRRSVPEAEISVLATAQAIAQAGIDYKNIDLNTVSVVFGASSPGIGTLANEITRFQERRSTPELWSHLFVLRAASNLVAAEICNCFGFQGPHFMVSSACASGNTALINGAHLLLAGVTKHVIVGSTAINHNFFGSYAGFRSKGILAHHEVAAKASRPFDKNRNGVVISEGAGAFVLERRSSALERGVRPLAELAGWAMNTDASDMVHPNSFRQIECMKASIHLANLLPTDIDFVNTHATGTEIGDNQEMQALSGVFSDHPNVYTNNTKSIMGHPMSSSASIELAANIDSFFDKEIHPTINCEDLDENCKFGQLVQNKSIKMEKINYFVKNSIGLLGANTSIVLKKPDF